MSEASSQFRSLLLRAREGDETSFGMLLDMYRSALRNAAAHELGDRVRVRTDASDVVQQTMLSAMRNFDAFAGNDEPAFVAWLQKIQTRNVQDCLRQHVRAERRSVRREVAIDDSNFVTDGLPNNGQPPPEKHAHDQERIARLQKAIAQLPHDQQIAVRMRHLEGRTLEEIATSMEKSKMAVASLITRGLRNLRSTLSPEDLQDGHR